MGIVYVRSKGALGLGH